MRIVLQRLYIIEKIFNLFDFALRKVTCQWKFRLSFPCQHTYKLVCCSQYQDWLTKSVLGSCQSWKWLCIEGWSNKISMLFPSWIRKMNIVLFERNALVDKSFVRSKAVDLLTLWRKSYMTGIDGWCLDASFKTLFNKIAAELSWQKSWRVWTEMLSSKTKQFLFWERYAGVRLI